MSTYVQRARHHVARVFCASSHFRCCVSTHDLGILRPKVCCACGEPNVLGRLHRPTPRPPPSTAAPHLACDDAAAGVAAHSNQDHERAILAQLAKRECVGRRATSRARLAKHCSTVDSSHKKWGSSHRMKFRFLQVHPLYYLPRYSGGSMLRRPEIE